MNHSVLHRRHKICSSFFRRSFFQFSRDILRKKRFKNTRQFFAYSCFMVCSFRLNQAINCRRQSKSIKARCAIIVPQFKVAKSYRFTSAQYIPLQVLTKCIDFLFPKSTNYNFGSVGKTMVAVENPPTNASNIDRGLAPVCAGARKKERNSYEEQQPDQWSPGP